MLSAAAAGKFNDARDVPWLTRRTRNQPVSAPPETVEAKAG